jgi:sulfur-oxidizing protein SoxY
MARESGVSGLSRRRLLALAAAWASVGLSPPSFASESDDDDAAELIEHLTGKTPTPSDRVRLVMPSVFPNGYTVPLSLDVDSPMTETDHVKSIRVLAPQNPLIEVATFHFTPERSQARASTRIRLAEPQFVLAVAEMSDGALLFSKAWVDVATDGCK